MLSARRSSSGIGARDPGQLHRDQRFTLQAGGAALKLTHCHGDTHYVPYFNSSSGSLAMFTAIRRASSRVRSWQPRCDRARPRYKTFAVWPGARLSSAVISSNHVRGAIFVARCGRGLSCRQKYCVLLHALYLSCYWSLRRSLRTRGRRGWYHCCRYRTSLVPPLARRPRYRRRCRDHAPRPRTITGTRCAEPRCWFQ
jgi:hypothetical protein